MAQVRLLYLGFRRQAAPKKGAENVISIDKVLELMIMFSTLVLLIASFNHEKK